MYSAHPLVHGFPGKSKSHGAFGWSSLWLLSDARRNILVDTGPFAYIPLIPQSLERVGLSADDITDVIFTHLHWDHLANFTMFGQATLWVGQTELNWASDQSAGTPFVSDVHVRELLRVGERLQRVSNGEQILGGISVINTPGHTPGHLAFHLETETGDHIFAGDSVKNIRELTTARADSTMDAEASRASIDRLRSLLRDTSGLLVPGHDLPLVMNGKSIERQSSQTIQMSYFPDSDEDERAFDISIPAGTKLYEREVTNGIPQD